MKNFYKINLCVIILYISNSYIQKGRMTVHDVQMNERGQITIPKEIRNKANFNPKDTLKIEIDENGRVYISKKDILDDLEDLIKKDLIREGYSSYELEKKIPERKKELAKALLDMVDESKKQIKSGDYDNLQDLKKELKDEGLL